MMNKQTTDKAYDLFSSIRVVLSHPSHPGNIGATARAMKTMGMSKLYLVNPQSFPSPQAYALASHADDILDHAVVVDALKTALVGTTVQVASTARRRELSPLLQTPRAIAPELLMEVQQGGEVALVFGTEMSGLTVEEVRLCNRLVSIPSNPVYASLNLAQAVQILCYELRMAFDDDLSHLEEKHVYACHEDLEHFFKHLEETLIKIEFLKPDHPKRLMPRLMRLFQRARLEREEVDILRGMLCAISKNKRTCL